MKARGIRLLGDTKVGSQNLPYITAKARTQERNGQRVGVYPLPARGGKSWAKVQVYPEHIMVWIVADNIGTPTLLFSGGDIDNTFTNQYKTYDGLEYISTSLYLDHTNDVQSFIMYTNLSSKREFEKSKTKSIKYKTKLDTDKLADIFFGYIKTNDSDRLMTETGSEDKTGYRMPKFISKDEDYTVLGGFGKRDVIPQISYIKHESYISTTSGDDEPFLLPYPGAMLTTAPPMVLRNDKKRTLVVEGIVGSEVISAVKWRNWVIGIDDYNTFKVWPIADPNSLSTINIDLGEYNQEEWLQIQWEFNDKGNKLIGVLRKAIESYDLKGAYGQQGSVLFGENIPLTVAGHATPCIITINPYIKDGKLKLDPIVELQPYVKNLVAASWYAGPVPKADSDVISYAYIEQNVRSIENPYNFDNTVFLGNLDNIVNQGGDFTDTIHTNIVLDTCTPVRTELPSSIYEWSVALVFKTSLSTTRYSSKILYKAHTGTLLYPQYKDVPVYHAVKWIKSSFDRTIAYTRWSSLDVRTHALSLGVAVDVKTEGNFYSGSWYDTNNKYELDNGRCLVDKWETYTKGESAYCVYAQPLASIYEDPEFPTGHVNTYMLGRKGYSSMSFLPPHPSDVKFPDEDAPDGLYKYSHILSDNNKDLLEVYNEIRSEEISWNIDNSEEHNKHAYFLLTKYTAPLKSDISVYYNGLTKKVSASSQTVVPRLRDYKSGINTIRYTFMGNEPLPGPTPPYLIDPKYVWLEFDDGSRADGYPSRPVFNMDENYIDGYGTLRKQFFSTGYFFSNFLNRYTRWTSAFEKYEDVLQEVETLSFLQFENTEFDDSYSSVCRELKHGDLNDKQHIDFKQGSEVEYHISYGGSSYMFKANVDFYSYIRAYRLRREAAVFI